MFQLLFIISALITTNTIFCMDKTEKIAFYNYSGREVTIQVIATKLMPDGRGGDAMKTTPESLLNQHFCFINRPITQKLTHCSIIHVSTSNPPLKTSYSEDTATLSWDFLETYYSITMQNGEIAVVMPTMKLKSRED